MAEKKKKKAQALELADTIAKSKQGASVSDILSGRIGAGQGSVDKGLQLPGGDQLFNTDPYKFSPLISNLRTPWSFNVPFLPEEEILRKRAIGSLLGAEQNIAPRPLDFQTNPYLRQMEQQLRGSSEANLERTLNQYTSNANRAGALGGSRDALMRGAAIGESARGLNESLGDILSKERGYNIQAGYQSPQLQKEILDLAARPRQFAQQERDRVIGELSRQQSERLLPLQLGQGQIAQRLGASTVQPPKSGGGIGSAIGGALGGVAAGAPLGPWGMAAGGLGGLLSGIF